MTDLQPVQSCCRLLQMLVDRQQVPDQGQQGLGVRGEGDAASVPEKEGETQLVSMAFRTWLTPDWV